jgi:hypothetical protein
MLQNTENAAILRISQSMPRLGTEALLAIRGAIAAAMLDKAG